MDDVTAEKIARNNAAFREANDSIEKTAKSQGLDRDAPIPFICECSDRACTQIIGLTLAEYEHVRSDPRWFTHAPSHEERVDGAVAPVERHSRYVIVEKLNHAGEIATELAANPGEE